MDLMLLRTFQRQVAFQCKCLLTAAQGLDVALKSHNGEFIFYELQNLLNAGANISKALWGQGGSLAKQRKPLRDSVGIADTSPLRSVTMRNNFEHFDERIDRWWKKSQSRNHADILVGPADMIIGIADIDRFRHYDPTTTDMIFWGEKFNIRDIVHEADRFLPRFVAEGQKPHWEPGSPIPAAAPSGTPPDGAKAQ